MAQFPESPSFTRFNTPSRVEADVVNLAHQGTIPPRLNGAFSRVQPYPQFPPCLADDDGTPLTRDHAAKDSPDREEGSGEVASNEAVSIVV